MGHYCRICGRVRANERFSGRGHRRHICKQCQQRPKAEIETIERRDEIHGFMHQSNISLRNMKRLEALIETADPETSQRASLVLEVARVKPGKRRRIRALREQRPGLLDELEEAGLIDIEPW